jgi:hypothetical protein
MEPPMCGDQPCPAPTGDHPPGDHPECPEGTDCGPPPCPTGTTCEGMGHHDGPPIDPRSGQPFTPADEAKYQVYADECESSGGTLSAASLAILIGDGFTTEQVNGLCQMSAHEGPPPGEHGGPQQGDPCMEVAAGPDRAACYATQK